MKKTIEKTVWTIDDPNMPKSVKAKAIQRHADINVDYEWWESTYEDAATIGLKITGFNEHEARGTLTKSGTEVADLIIANHGETCNTYKLAKQYWLDHDELIAKAPKDENGDWEDERALDSAIDDLEREFRLALLEEYRIMLRNEYEHLTSEKSIIETLQNNEYFFDETGRVV